MVAAYSQLGKPRCHPPLLPPSRHRVFIKWTPTQIAPQDIAPEDTLTPMDASEIRYESSEDKATSSSGSDDKAEQRPGVFKDGGRLRFRLEIYLHLNSRVLNLPLT